MATTNELCQGPEWDKYLLALSERDGIPIERLRSMMAQELEIRQARARGVPDWAIEMAKAVPTEMTRSIALRDNRAPQGPSSQGIIPSSQMMTSVRPGGGANTGGWQIERRFGEDGRHPTAHVAACDRLMDEQDRRDKAELKQKLARR